MKESDITRSSLNCSHTHNQCSVTEHLAKAAPLENPCHKAEMLSYITCKLIQIIHRKTYIKLDLFFYLFQTAFILLRFKTKAFLKWVRDFKSTSDLYTSAILIIVQ